MNIFRHKPEAYLFFILVISAQVVTSEKAFTCQTDMDCPVNIAPTCDNFNYCECNVNTACSPSSVMLLPNTINNVTIAGNSFNNYYKIYQTVLTSVEITYSFTDVTGNNDKFNVFFLAYIGSSYLLISQFLGQLFGANPTNFTLPMLSLGRLPDNTDQYIVILLENVGGNTVMLTIQSSQASPNTSTVFLIIGYTFGGILGVFGVIVFLCFCYKGRWGLSETTNAEPIKQFEISYFQTWMPATPVSAAVKNAIQVCSVCLQELELEALVRKTVCQHYFHKECLDSWCKKNLTCPMCRAELDEKNIRKLVEAERKSSTNSDWIHNSMQQEVQEVQERVRNHIQNNSGKQFRQSLIGNSNL